MDTFNIEQFEHDCIYNKSTAVSILIDLLSNFDKTHGNWPIVNTSIKLNLPNKDLIQNYIISRILGSLNYLFISETDFITNNQKIQLLSLQRWLAILYGASDLKNADHLINLITKKNTNSISIKKEQFYSILLLCFPDSSHDFSLDELWLINKELTLSWCLSILSNRIIITKEGFLKREKILEYLDSKHEENFNIDLIPQSILHDVYMHCSYAFTPKKHGVKKIINKIILNLLHKNNITDIQNFTNSNKRKIFVIVEWFTSSHSIYRTHSKSIEGLKDKFEVIGIGYSEMVDKTTIKSFNKYISIPKTTVLNQIKFIKGLALQENPIFIYMPSVGMFPLTVWLSNLRIAKFQFIGLGHPATTFSSHIDYVVVEEDFIGKEEVFSEKLLRLPKNAMPYRYPPDFNEKLLFKRNKTNLKNKNITVCATSMKINYVFLNTCNEISKKSVKKINFNFLIGNVRGISHKYISKVFNTLLNCSYIIHGQQSYSDYLSKIADSDLFINPFPFGNTNGLIDTVLVEKVGICKTGEQVHEHIDEGLFRRIGFPDWTITNTVSEYINATLKLLHECDSISDYKTKKHSTNLKKYVLNGDISILSKLLIEITNDK